MLERKTFPPDVFDFRHRFLNRPKLFADRSRVQAAAFQIRRLLFTGETAELRHVLDQVYPPDLADILEFLDEAQDQALFDLLTPAEAADVLDELDQQTREALIRAAPPERLVQIAEALPSDDAADILAGLSGSRREQVLAAMDPGDAQQVRFLLHFPPDSAGRNMSLGFVSIPIEATAGEALEKVKATPDVESIFSVYLVDDAGGLQGIADLRLLLSVSPDRRVAEVIQPGLIYTHPYVDREAVARIFARYDLSSLPVVTDDPARRLLGVITADDIINVIEQENTEDILRMAGSDAAEMERRSPVQTALMRLPWIMMTMFVELGAGFVIHLFNGTLARLLLLASFMPVISAISGNTGLQSATIIVRGLSTGTVRVTAWQKAVARQLVMTLILGSAAGLTLGVIGALWYGRWTFGLVVALGMFAAVNIAGVVGTVVPLTSKRLGFDPAITSGPFETAFQDVVGISIFLTLATLMLGYILK